MRERRLGLAALAALIVLDLVLIVMALNSGSSGSATKVAADVTRTSVVSGGSAAASAAGGSPSAGATSGAGTDAAAPQALQTVLNADGSLFSVKPGVCGFGGAAASLQNPTTSTTNDVALPVQVVSAVDTLGNGTDYVVGSAPECADIQFYAKEGEGWGSGLPLAEIFALVPKDNGLVITPEWGVKASPCPAISLAAGDPGKAFVLCREGSVMQVTSDGFNGTGRLAGGRALAAAAGNILFAAAQADGCNGLAVSTSINSGASWQQLSCIAGAAGDGSVGIALRDRSVAVVDATGKIYRSSDNGVTFITS